MGYSEVPASAVVTLNKHKKQETNTQQKGNPTRRPRTVILKGNPKRRPRTATQRKVEQLYSYNQQYGQTVMKPAKWADIQKSAGKRAAQKIKW